MFLEGSGDSMDNGMETRDWAVVEFPETKREHGAGHVYNVPDGQELVPGGVWG